MHLPFSARYRPEASTKLLDPARRARLANDFLHELTSAAVRLLLVCARGESCWRVRLPATFRSLARLRRTYEFILQGHPPAKRVLVQLLKAAAFARRMAGGTPGAADLYSQLCTLPPWLA